MRVEVRPELLRWARERAGLSVAHVVRRLPKFAEWESGTRQPTLKQLEAFARLTHAPIGYLFLPSAPEEAVPIPDFRTVADGGVKRPSPDLLDTIYACQERQTWYREFATAEGLTGPLFVGSLSLETDVTTAAASMHSALGFDVRDRRTGTWEDALRRLVEQADASGVMVMASGVVGSNTHRVLAPGEFRGFALVDQLAPLIFINGADTKSAQMFTVVHELAHIWLGQSALSDVQPERVPTSSVERWCNRVAAEFLMPAEAVLGEYRPGSALPAESQRLARVFKVSTLVVLRRLHDVGLLSRETMWTEYEAEVERLRAVPRSSGGDFYNTLPIRVSRRFARALIAQTLEGQALYRDAFRMLGIAKADTFNEFARTVGAPA